MAAEMKFVLGADVSEALKAMTAVDQRTIILQKQIEFLQQKIGNTTSIKQFNTAMDALARKQSELSKITAQTGQTLQGKLVPGANQASLSMINLGRVVQDAPYGFIGIANNINPLVESFGRLKKETGSTGGAFKALAGSLAGPAGIGLAVSLVTSLLVVFGDKLFGTTKKSQENADTLAKVSTEQKILKGELLSTTEAEKKQTDQLQKQASELEKLNELIKRSGQSYAQRSAEAQGSVQQEIALVNSLASVVQNQSLSYEQRNNALTKLKSINETYFGDLKLEASSLATLTAKVQEYTNALVAQEVVKGYTKDIADLTIANNKQKTTLTELTAQQEKLKKTLAVTPKEVDYVESMNDGMGRLTVKTKIVNDDYRNTERELTKINQQISDQKAIIDKGSQSVTKLTKDLNGAVIEASKFKSPEIKPPKVGKVKVDNKKVEKDIKGEFDKIQVEFDFVNPVLKALQAPEILTEAQKIGKLINESIEKNIKPLPSIINPKVQADLEKQKSELQKQLEFAQFTADGISNAFGQAFGSILEGENVFTALGKSLKAFVFELIQATVKALIFRAIVNAFNPAFASASGATGILNLLGKRANGGPVTGRSPYIVGERGPELFVPSVSGNILPNNRLSSFNGRPAFATSMGGRSIVRGNDILLASARTQRSQNRVNA